MTYTQRTSAAFQAAEYMREQIISGKLPPGIQLRQDAIALELDMSRVPVREALSSLVIEGLLEHIPNRGFFVRQYSIGELEELYWVRDALEPKLISSITSFDENAVNAIARTHEALSHAVADGDIPTIVRHNRDFHLQMMSLSNLTIILDLAKQVWAMQSGYTAIYLASKTDHGAMVSEHAGMVEALRAHDAARLTELCDLHRHAGDRRLHRILGAKPGGSQTRPSRGAASTGAMSRLPHQRGSAGGTGRQP